VNDALISQVQAQAYLKANSNWSRWGKDDQMGAINLITAEKRLKRALVLGKIVELERLTVTDDDVDSEINAFVQLVGASGENLRKSLASRSSRKALAMDLITGQALRRVAEIAKGENIPLPGAEVQAEAEMAAQEL